MTSCAFLLCAAGLWAQVPPTPTSLVQKPAPAFVRNDLAGKKIILENYRGKVVLLDFWATWCGPCKIEIPWFIDLQRKNKDRGFEVLGVAMDDNGWDDVKPFLAEMQVNYRVVIGDSATSDAYGGVDSLPTTFLIDRDGKIAAIHIGVSSRKDFEDGIEELLEAKTATGDIGNRANGLPALFMVPNRH